MEGRPDHTSAIVGRNLLGRFSHRCRRLFTESRIDFKSGFPTILSLPDFGPQRVRFGSKKAVRKPAKIMKGLEVLRAFWQIKYSDRPLIQLREFAELRDRERFPTCLPLLQAVNRDLQL